VVASQGLLVLGATQQHHITRLVESVDHIDKCDMVAFLGVGLYLWTAIIDVRGQDRFRTVYHEEGCEACGSARRGTQAP
jgi:ASC-1-like (ASCH) protein